ncbi:hypothetical protein OG458_42045 (plasmid) [Streptomyces sp. NBC_01281]|uniref:hypothetical protein n=1 Tax=Streptomyces sp. NBC_01281 TaxID=2903811 RepID=UPI002E1175C0|nr:hypothetical protein OG458_42045 [Streptomyces sp. NBC_01281]
MAHGTDNRGDSAPRPNKILATPATVAACAADRRTPGEQSTAEGAARDQIAFTRMSAGGAR